jgi:hypothetical protein
LVRSFCRKLVLGSCAEYFDRLVSDGSVVCCCLLSYISADIHFVHDVREYGLPSLTYPGARVVTNYSSLKGFGFGLFGFSPGNALSVNLLGGLAQ